MTINLDQPKEQEVKGLVVYATRWAIILVIAKQLITIATTMIVSRNVSPSDTGAVGMVLTLIAFVVLFDTGLSWATVQPKALLKDQLDGMFWLGCLLGAALWFFCSVMGPLLAILYKEPRLTNICLIMGAAPFFNSMTTQLSSLLKRQMRQKENNLVDTAAILLSSIVGVLLALAKFGYWAIAIQAVVFQFIRFILLLFVTQYNPGVPRFSVDSLKILKVGGVLALSNYICYFQLYLVTIMAGYLFGATSLGYYLKATGLKALPTMYAAMVVTDVMVSALSALQANERMAEDAYYKALRMIALVGCPAGAMLFPFADEAVRVFYGDQWDLAVPLLRWLALPAVMLPITTTTIWLFLAIGNPRPQLLMNVFLTTITFIYYGLVVKYVKTLEGLVIAESALFTLIVPVVNIMVSHRVAGLSVAATLRVIAPIIFISAVSALSVVVFNNIFVGYFSSWMLLMLAKIAVGIIVYVGLSILLIRPFPLDFNWMRVKGGGVQ